MLGAFQCSFVLSASLECNSNDLSGLFECQTGMFRVVLDRVNLVSGTSKELSSYHNQQLQCSAVQCDLRQESHTKSSATFKEQMSHCSIWLQHFGARCLIMALFRARHLNRLMEMYYSYRGVSFPTIVWWIIKYAFRIKSIKMMLRWWYWYLDFWELDPLCGMYLWYVYFYAMLFFLDIAPFVNLFQHSNAALQLTLHFILIMQKGLFTH